MIKPMSERMQKIAKRYEKATGKRFGLKTNADRIRVMNDEELADALMMFLVKAMENSEFANVRVEFEDGYRDALLRELRQPAKDGDDE